MQYYLAVDIGASSGRHILGHISNGKLELQEIYRFENGIENVNGKLLWNTEKLFNDVLQGIKKCKELGIVPYSVGIDTWGVDYALLNKDDKIIDEVYSYRDNRTENAPALVEEKMSFSRLYEITGIQKCNFNTIYQLYLDKLSGKLDKAESMLSIPDLLHFYLTGVKANEYTDASTMALLNAKTKTWDNEIIETLGFPKKIFGNIVEPGTILGDFSKEIQKEVGFNSKVVVPASHDTASAVMSIPSLDKNPLYISSGTWSLLGTELNSPITTTKALEYNITNEGGYNNTIRFLKNITGMWTIQNIRKELNNKYAFQELMDMARTSKIETVVDLNDSMFLAPDSMINAVKEYARKTNQQVPQEIGDITRCVYLSLATLYAKTIKEMEEITGITFDSLNIVGGGSQAKFLNEVTKQKTNKRVFVGLTEGTAVGNLICQAISSKEVENIIEGRKIIINSFDIYEV